MATGKQQFDLKASGSGDPNWHGGMDELNKLISALHPEKLEDCSKSFADAATKLQATADEIYDVGFQLSTLWKGDAAAKAQEQLKQLWETSQNLADTASMVGNNLFHNHYLTLKDVPGQAPKPEHWGAGIGAVAGSVAGPVGSLAGGLIGNSIDGHHDDDMARDWVNNTLTPAAGMDNSGVPDYLRTDLPDAKPAAGEPNNKKQPKIPTGGGLPHGGTPGGGIPTHPGGNLPTHPGGNLPTHPGGNLPTHPGGNLPDEGGYDLPPHGSDLAGFHPGGGGGLGGGGLGGGLGGGGGGLGGGGLGGGGLDGGGLGGGGLSGGGGLGGAGSLAAQEAAAAERAAMAGKGGANGMPMGGMGGGGGQKEERERTTWLTEDEDVWGGDGDAAPPVIG